MRFLVALLAVLFNQTLPQEVRITSSVYTPQPPTIRVQSNLLELGATVRDNHGKFASGLQAADFEVLDKGVPQTIKLFSEQDIASAVTGPPRGAPGAARPVAPQATAPPRTIALFFDDTHTELYGLQKSKQGAGKLAASGLLPGDRAGIFTGSGTVTQDFTTDTKLLLDAIARVGMHHHIGLHGLGDCPTLNPYQAYVINFRLDIETEEAAVNQVCGCISSLCDGPGRPRAHEHVRTVADSVWNQFRHNSTEVMDVLGVVLKYLAAQPENRILVMISPGFATPQMERNKDAIVEAALRAHIVINSLNAEGLTAGMNVRALTLRQTLLSEFMSDISAATGGQFIHDSNDFTGNLRKLSSLPEISYLLGFSPAAAPDGKYHELKVRLVNHSGFHVESRPGYFAAIVSKGPETVQERIDREASSKETLAELPATVQVSAGNSKSGLLTIDVNIQVDANHLKFVEKDDRQVQQLTFVTLLQDGQGHMIAGKEAVMDLSLTPATLADMQAKGIKAGVTLTAPAGSYQVREIVREAVENHMAASNTPVAPR
jgi:VWFA-related protein